MVSPPSSNGDGFGKRTRQNDHLPNLASGISGGMRAAARIVSMFVTSLHFQPTTGRQSVRDRPHAEPRSHVRFRRRARPPGSWPSDDASGTRAPHIDHRPSILWPSVARTSNDADRPALPGIRGSCTRAWTTTANAEASETGGAWAGSASSGRRRLRRACGEDPKGHRRARGF